MISELMVNTFLKWFCIIGLALVVFIPIIPGVNVATDLFFPFITGKNFAFRIITELVFGAWLILAMRDVKYRPKFSWLAAAVAIFIVAIGIADAFSAYPFKSFWSNNERMEGFVTLLHLAAYFTAASSVLNTEKLWTRFLQSSVLVSFLVGCYGILQLLGKIPINQGGVRLDGPMGNAAYLGAYMLMNFFITMFLFARHGKSMFIRWVYGILMLLQVYILYHTATRGAILGLLGGAMIAAVITAVFTRGWNFSRKAALGAIIAIVVLGVGAMALKNSNFVKSQPSLVRLTSISRSEAGPRFMVWNMALQGFKERPIFGWGQESFNYVFNKYYDPKMYAQEQWFDRTHDIIFDWLIAGGIVGLLSYLFILASALYYVWKQGESDFSVKKCLSVLAFWRKKEIPHITEKSILTGLFAAYFFQNIFVFDNITSYITLFIILAYIHFLSARPIGLVSEEKLKTPAQKTNLIFAPLIGILTILVVYLVNINPIKASMTLIDALRPQQSGVETNLEHFKKALSYGSFSNPEIREQLAQAAIQVVYSQSVDLKVKQAYYDLARTELLKQVALTPNDARYHLFLGSFLNRARSYDEAIVYLTKASELSPKKQTILFELGSAYLNKGDFTTALTIMKKAYDYEPNFGEARIIYAVALIYSKQFDQADGILAPFKGTPTAYDERLIQAYTSAGEKAKVLELTKQKVSDNPNDSQSLFSLAAAYLSVGERTNAINALISAEEVNPSAKEQAEYYIKEIRAGRNP